MDVPKQILQLIPTTQERSELLAEIDLLTKSLFQEDEDSFKNVLRNDIGKDSAGILSHLLEKEESLKQREAFLTSLKEALLALPLLHLTVAVKPSEAGLELLAKKSRSLFAPTVILDIVVDENIFGGALVSYGGRYADCSLATKMDDYFAKIKNQKSHPKGDQPLAEKIKNTVQN